MSTQVIFNKLESNIIEQKAIKDCKGFFDSYIFEIRAKAPIHSWNYINNYPVDTEEFIYEYDLDINSFNIVPIQSENKLIISLSGKHPLYNLEKIINILFNEKGNEYDHELGYSGWDLSCKLISDNNELMLDIKDKYDIQFFEVDVA